MQYAFCTSEYAESAVDACSVQSSALVVPACVFYTVAQRGKGDSKNQQCNSDREESDQEDFS